MARNVVPPTPEERARRAQFLHATLITCIVLAFVAGSIHVIFLGSIRMTQMRDKATYDLRDEAHHERAAGEDITIHEKSEKIAQLGETERAYTVGEVTNMLSHEQWVELDSMVTIPAGTFEMGTNYARADAQDKPMHKVYLPEYRIDKYLVTNVQYARFLAATGHRPPSNWKNGKIPAGELLRPVTMVDWFDAEEYARWAGERLPTEAEWEKAARGTDGRRWPWGNVMDPARLNTYYSAGSTTDVDHYKNGVSPYGVFDMAGNVEEWVQDDFLPYKGSHAPAEIFQGRLAEGQTPEDRDMKITEFVPIYNRHYKVLRGGSWKSDPFSTATYHRNYDWPNYMSDFFGFRCATSAGGPRRDLDANQ